MSSTAVQNPACGYCGGFHDGRVCPRVRSQEFFPNGMVAKVEFWPGADEPEALVGVVGPVTFRDVTRGPGA